MTVADFFDPRHPAMLRAGELTYSASQAPPPPPWPPLWGERPRMASHFGPSQIFPVLPPPNCGWDPNGNYYGQRTWNSWVNFFGRTPNIVGSLSVAYSWDRYTTWDAVAGGAGSSDTTWDYSLEVTRNLFCTQWIPATTPICFVFGPVPRHVDFANAWNYQFPNRTSIYRRIANGEFDVVFQRYFRRLAELHNWAGRDPRRSVLDLAWEANGNWFPWSIGPDVQAFIDGWRRIVDIMRAMFDQKVGGGRYPLVCWAPDRALRFGSGTGQRMWDAYPGDDWVDVIGIRIHDTIGMQHESQWSYFLEYDGAQREGFRHMLEFARSRNKWIGVPEMSIQVNSWQYWPRTQNPAAFWNGFEQHIRRPYYERFIFFVYMFVDGDHTRTDNTATRPWNQQGDWGKPMQDMYKLDGLADQWGDTLPR